MSVNGRLRTVFIILLILGSGSLIGAPLVHGDPVYDFVQSASSATWYSGAGTLPFPGSTSDSRGFALNLVNAQLEDDSVYPLVLETHPQWVVDGYITGVYPLQSIAQNTRLKVKTGLLKGAAGSDGVNFEVILDVNQVQHSLVNIYSSYDGKLDEATVDLGQYAGQTGRFILTVKAGKSSGQDWAVWTEAKVESTAQPDLTVTNISLSGSTISYKLKNVGSASVGSKAAPASFTNLLMVDGKQVAYDPFTGTLDPGQQVTRSFNYVFKQTPPYNVVRVCADWDQKVAEKDEGNNCLEEVWGFGYPDLRANGLFWSPSTVTLGSTVHLVPDIKNIGEADSSPCKVEFKVDDVSIGSLTIPAIPAGMKLADVDSQLSLPWVPTEVGEHEIVFTVDSEGEVEESDETNNEVGNIIDVLPEDSTPPTASIYPTPLKLWGEPINERDDVTFVAGASDPSGIQSITIYVDGMAKKTEYDSTTCRYNAGPLPRLSTVHYAAGVWDKAGNYFLTPTYTLTIESYYSQPAQVDIEVSPAVPTEVDAVTFTATASYPYGVDKLRIYLNGHKVAEEEGATTLSITRGPWARDYTGSYFAEVIDVDGRTRRTPERSFTIGGLDRYNVKNMNAYVDREIFVVSDLDWRLVCQLVPIAVWKEMHPTEPVAVGSTYSFPVLIYHEEDGSRFDADSVIRFIEQYAEYGRNRFGLRVTILGDPPDELVRLLESTVFMETRETDHVRVWRPTTATTASTIVSLRSTVIDGGRSLSSAQGLGDALMDRWGVGATISEEGVTGVVPMDDLFTDEEERSLREEYWSTLNVYVLSEDEYSTALMASVHASLLDAPLILQGHYDLGELYHKSVYLVGDFTDEEVEALRSGGVNILSRFTLNELRRHYVIATGTNKLILVNPLDLWTSHRRDYVTDEGGTVSYLFGKHSLAAPFLAADKKEAIISIPSSSYPEIDAYVKESFETLMPGSGLKYLTIMATPEAIPIARANVPSPIAIHGDTIYYQGQRYIDTDIVSNSLRGDDESYLFTEPRMQFSPACSGDLVAWVDEDTWGDIWYRRVPTGTNVRLTGASEPWAGQSRPAVYGNTIVWQDGRNGNSDIRMHNAATGLTLTITDSPKSDEQPAIWDDTIVWQRREGGHWKIMRYDIVSRIEAQVSPNEYYAFERPAIWENRVVYVSYRGGENWDVFMSTLGTTATTRITNNPSMQWMPKIYGDHIVWQDNRNGDWDIYTYTISSATETRLTSEAIDQILPSIWGDNVVWQERGTDGFWYIVHHDLRTGLSRRIIRTEVSADDGPLWLELDGRYYGSKINMGRQDIATGRIYGITVADASAYVARDLFYERINKDRDALVVVREDYQEGIDDATDGADLEAYARSHYWTAEMEDHFRDVYFYAGHTEVDSNSRTIYNKYDEVGLVVFVDHGIMDGFSSTMDSYHMQRIQMQLQPVTVIDLACLTGAYNVMATVGDPTDLMSAQNIRRGAMVYMGATDVSYWHNMFDNILDGLYNERKTIGEVYMEARNEDYDEDVWCFSLTLRGDIFYALHGDPTFKPKWEAWEREEVWHP